MHTLFIEGLPQGFNSHELRRLFSNHGYIIDAFIPQIQRNRLNGRFGFIEVQAWEQGESLIHEVDGMVIGSSKIKVQWAKYPKRMRQPRRSGLSEKGVEFFGNSMNGRSKQHTGRDRINAEDPEKDKTAKVVKVEEVLDNLEWLGRSLTCISDVPRDIDSLRLLITQAFQEHIVLRDLGKFKFLLTLDSKEAKDKLKIEGFERLKQWFSSVDDWVESDVCLTRRLRLELVGLPVQVWSEQNIKKIAETWGDVVLVEMESYKLGSFASAKVVIDTLCMKPIDDEVIIQVKDKGFKVSVFEARTEYTIFHSGPLDGVSLGPAASLDNDKGSDGDMEDQLHLDCGNRQVLGNNGVLQGGSEVEQAQDRRCDLNLNLNSNSPRHLDLHRDCHIEAVKALVLGDANHDGCVEGLSVGKLQGEAERTQANALDAVLVGTQGLLEDRHKANDAVSFSSSSKTKTAQLSGNDYSMEMEKINQLKIDQLRRVQVDDLQDEVNQIVPCPVQSGSVVSVPPGFGIQGDSSPPDFEGSTAQVSSVFGKGLAKRKHTAPVVAKRMTRSQVKKTKTQVSRRQSNTVRTRAGKLNVEVSPTGRLSIDTTESMKKLAEKALAVGELLGVKVISHKANAVKRITDSLKVNRGTGSSQARH